ncbi:vesicle trafficking 1 [Calliopsis andreniformis]|uniref:vesicle trafficking 1 n=1 Tax=Calliopsis andreniformis TaxID=337506 RepID=UPI003FCC37B3
MFGPDLPEIPSPLKSIQHYLKVASTHDQRDPVVSYWCRLYALQTGLKLSTKTPEESAFLLKLIDWLEATKKELRDNEAITNDVAAQAHLENWALKLFLYADKNDRIGNFGKNIVQSFFTAGLLYDVLTVFGELSEEAAQNKKYAKWKAAYIHNCLKNGETPIPGPIQDNTENIDSDKCLDKEPDDEAISKMKSKEEERDASAKEAVDIRSSMVEDEADYNVTTKTEGGVELSLDQMNKAQKYIKWAGSALNYDDISTAVSNLQKALHLLTTGQEQE